MFKYINGRFNQKNVQGMGTALHALKRHALKRIACIKADHWSYHVQISHQENTRNYLHIRNQGEVFDDQEIPG